MDGEPTADAVPAKPFSLRRLRKEEVKEGIASHQIQSADSLAGTALRGGFLQKRSEQGLVKNWKKRYVVLVAEGLLYYFEGEHSKKPSGETAGRRDASVL